jgi:hypothetical protein
MRAHGKLAVLQVCWSDRVQGSERNLHHMHMGSWGASNKLAVLQVCVLACAADCLQQIVLSGQQLIVLELIQARPACTTQPDTLPTCPPPACLTD